MQKHDEIEVSVTAKELEKQFKSNVKLVAPIIHIGLDSIVNAQALLNALAIKVATIYNIDTSKQDIDSLYLSCKTRHAQSVSFMTEDCIPGSFAATFKMKSNIDAYIAKVPSLLIRPKDIKMLQDRLSRINTSGTYQTINQEIKTAARQYCFDNETHYLLVIYPFFNAIKKLLDITQLTISGLKQNPHSSLAILKLLNKQNKGSLKQTPNQNTPATTLSDIIKACTPEIISLKAIKMACVDYCAKKAVKEKITPLDLSENSQLFPKVKEKIQKNAIMYGLVLKTVQADFIFDDGKNRKLLEHLTTQWSETGSPVFIKKNDAFFVFRRTPDGTWNTTPVNEPNALTGLKFGKDTVFIPSANVTLEQHKQICHYHTQEIDYKKITTELITESCYEVVSEELNNNSPIDLNALQNNPIKFQEILEVLLKDIWEDIDFLKMNIKACSQQDLDEVKLQSCQQQLAIQLANLWEKAGNVGLLDFLEVIMAFNQNKNQDKELIQWVISNFQSDLPEETGNITSPIKEFIVGMIATLGLLEELVYKTILKEEKIDAVIHMLNEFKGLNKSNNSQPQINLISFLVKVIGNKGNLIVAVNNAIQIQKFEELFEPSKSRSLPFSITLESQEELRLYEIASSKPDERSNLLKETFQYIDLEKVTPVDVMRKILIQQKIQRLGEIFKKLNKIIPPQRGNYLVVINEYFTSLKNNKKILGIDFFIEAISSVYHGKKEGAYQTPILTLFAQDKLDNIEKSLEDIEKLIMKKVFDCYVSYGVLSFDVQLMTSGALKELNNLKPRVIYLSEEGSGFQYRVLGTPGVKNGKFDKNKISYIERHWSSDNTRNNKFLNDHVNEILQTVSGGDRTVLESLLPATLTPEQKTVLLAIDIFDVTRVSELNTKTENNDGSSNNQSTPEYDAYLNEKIINSFVLLKDDVKPGQQSIEEIFDALQELKKSAYIPKRQQDSAEGFGRTDNSGPFAQKPQSQDGLPMQSNNNSLSVVSMNQTEE